MIQARNNPTCQFFISTILSYLLSLSSTYAISPDNVLHDQAIMRKETLQSLEVEAEISITINGETTAADCILKMGGRDSLSMEISGPFGISVARLFAEKNYFLFHDMLQGRAIEGIPTQQQLSEITFMPLSFDDYASLFRAEPPGDPLSFTLVDSYSDSTRFLYKRLSSAQTVEFILCSKENGTIKEYQRKNAEGTVELSMIYDKYSEINGVFMPGIVTLSAPSRELQLTITSDNISVNPLLSPLRFQLPSSIKPLRME